MVLENRFAFLIRTNREDDVMAVLELDAIPEGGECIGDSPSLEEVVDAVSSDKATATS